MWLKYAFKTVGKKRHGNTVENVTENKPCKSNPNESQRDQTKPKTVWGKEGGL